ncbi:hypothetical protein [Cerasicoccus frondis]|uniref:hypothetical protein n=1 Tax=Cerasicoccus frondis TaxID=490090 RepID=UPI002852A719|nr:hypothetical protein [Cerasicoccus frondis]
MPRRAAADPLPLWIKTIALVLPISLVGGYVGYQQHLAQAQEEESQQLRMKDAPEQFVRDEAVAATGLRSLAADSGNIGSQGYYEEQLVDLKASEKSLLEQGEAASGSLLDSGEIKLLPKSEIGSGLQTGDSFRFQPASQADFRPATSSDAAN